MKRYLPLLLIVAGLGVLMAGFVYDVMFAGIPYQDPTPAMSARYERHSGIASTIRSIGAGVFLIGSVVGIVRAIARPTRKTALSLLLVPFLSVFALPLVAQENFPRKAETFEVAGHTAFLYAAPKPAEGKPWLWYAPTLKGISLAGRKLYFESFLRAGISIAGFDLGEVRGGPASTEKFTLFYDAMVKRGFSTKPILLGQSRGGIMTLAWAFRHPDKMSAWVGIYPVCNLLSYPMKNLPVTLADFGMLEAEFRAHLKEFNPIDNLAGLAANKVPMFAVHGDSDKVVPYDDNTKLLKERYEAAGGSFNVKIIPGEGHQATASFFECRELVDFVLKHAR